MSGSLFEREFDERYGQAYQRPEVTNSAYKLIWMSCGTDDLFLADTKEFSELLKQKKVRHIFRECQGGHGMTTFRRELVELLPQLFR